VEILHVETGEARKLVADEAGRWQDPVVPPGEYEVRVSAPGFQMLLRKGVHVAVGQELVLDAKLEVGRNDTTISVTAEPPQVNVTSGSVSGLVDQRQMRDLPLNGRSFQQLALLQPGVNAVNTAGGDPVGGRTPKIAINGARPELSSFLLDGTDINDVYNKTPGSVGGVLLGVEAVLEFQVLTNSYSAEFGRSAGGVINAVTRSGGNMLHGSAFEFLRNSALDAKNFFDPASAPIPAFKRNQFGGVLGGPVQKDRTFFFGAYEELVDRLGVTGVTSVPTAAARATAVASVRPILDTFFPLPNGRDLGGGIGQYLFTAPQPTNERFWQGRIDHRFTPKTSAFGRYTIDDGTVNRPPINKLPVTNTAERSRNQYVTLEVQRIVSSRTLNSARVGFNRSTHESVNQRLTDVPPSLRWLPTEPMGFLTISGVVTENFGDYRLPRIDRLNNYQLGDTVFLTRGIHNLKIGGDFQRIQFNQNTSSQVGGLLTFTSLTNFLAGVPSQFDFALPGNVDPIRGYRQSLVAGFVQDDIRLRRNLTLNVGLRYETVTVPTEVNGKISNLRNPTDSVLNVGGEWYRNPSTKNFGPRIGAAFDPFSDGKTSIRGGFGLFFDEILPKYYFFSGALNPPFTKRSSITNPAFPNLLATFDPTNVKYQLQTTDYLLRNPYTLQFNLGIQRQLPGEVVASVGYSGSRGLHLFRIGDANLAPFTVADGIKIYNPAAGRMNSNFGSITQRATDAQSFYNALMVNVQKQWSHGLRAQAAYTFSRSVDDSSGINSQDFTTGGVYVLDFYDRKADRGLSSFWAKHVLTGNWSYELPRLKGWQLNSIVTVQSGHPFEIRNGFNRSGNQNTVNYAMHERPDAKAGVNPILGGPDRYWDINAFTLQPANRRGNLGRNTLIGPGIVNFDFSVTKSFRVSESARLDFRGEAFNLPNHPNFAAPSGVTAFTGPTTVAANWGVITSTVTTSRQVQFALKLMF
jgi:outer membrane receptor protein involved in Fe transport